MAKQKHLKKYAQIYTDMGFDVMVVHITPWQLLWPVKGTQVSILFFCAKTASANIRLTDAVLLYLVLYINFLIYLS